MTQQVNILALLQKEDQVWFPAPTSKLITICNSSSSSSSGLCEYQTCIWGRDMFAGITLIHIKNKIYIRKDILKWTEWSKASTAGERQMQLTKTHRKDRIYKKTDTGLGMPWEVVHFNQAYIHNGVKSQEQGSSLCREHPDRGLSSQQTSRPTCIYHLWNSFPCYLPVLLPSGTESSHVTYYKE